MLFTLAFSSGVVAVLAHFSDLRYGLFAYLVKNAQSLYIFNKGTHSLIDDNQFSGFCKHCALLFRSFDPSLMLLQHPLVLLPFLSKYTIYINMFIGFNI